MNLFASLVQRNPSYPYALESRNDPYLGALRLRYGHALTVHKAQGGEWPQVFVDTFVPNTVAERRGAPVEVHGAHARRGVRGPAGTRAALS